MTASRRTFVAGALAAFTATCLRASSKKIHTASHPGPDLIPHYGAKAPSYFCTWSAQNYVYGDGVSKLDASSLQGDAGAQLARTAMNQEQLFGTEGWARRFYASIRQDLYFLLDDGWEINGMASFLLDPQKFPGYGSSPQCRLQKLQQAIQDNGWRGTALWCRNPPDSKQGRELLQRSALSGIQYWKIDLGDPDFDLVRARDSLKLDVTLEHVHGEIPLSGEWKKDGRFGRQEWDSPRMRIYRNTDVYRTYDVTSILSLPTTLDRVAEIMLSAQEHPENNTLLNVEDEVYVAAVLGCTAGVMRHPLHGLRPGQDVDLFFNGPRRAKLRLDEVVRATRWQRIAPPFPPAHSKISVSSEILTDGWTFSEEQTWEKDLLGVPVKQGAPAILARDLPLPVVHAQGERPFVYAGRFPGGAVAIGSQQRTREEHAWFMPAAEVHVDVQDARGPFGVFGHYRKLVLHANYSFQGKRIYAQDLASDHCFEITNDVDFHESSISFRGDLLEHYGLYGATMGDLSSPGTLIQVV